MDSCGTDAEFDLVLKDHPMWCSEKKIYGFKGGAYSYDSKWTDCWYETIRSK